MHYTEYNQVCSKCGSPVKYKELGRSILITPCPCQTVKLAKACQDTFSWIANHFEDFDDETNGELLCLSNQIEQALANATK